MKRRTYALIAILTAVSGALLISTGTASAHVPASSADCQTGLTASAQDYAGTTNTVTVTFDSQTVLTETFSSSFAFTKPNPDKTVPHTYSVDIVGSDGQANLHTGVVTIPACEETPPPTTVPPVTTTTPPPPVFIVVPPPSPPTTITVVTPPPATPVVTTARFTG